MTPRVSLLSLLGACVLAAGCSVLSAKKDPTRFYDLTAATNRPPAAPKAGGRILVVAVDAAGYLENSSLAERVAPNQIRYYPFDQWAQPFEDAANQALRSGLAAATGLPVVDASQSFVVRDAVQVRVQLQRFEVLPGDRVQVAASWQLATSVVGDPIRQGQFWQERAFTPDPKSLQPAVAAGSELLAEVSRAIAADLP